MRPFCAASSGNSTANALCDLFPDIPIGYMRDDDGN